MDSESTRAEAPGVPVQTAGPIGRTLGEFVIKRKLGQGSFGAAYVADQALLGREAVVKILHESALDSPELRKRFLREARLASAVDHPFAAHVYSFGAEPDGLLWFAMEYVRGVPMSDWLKEQGAFPLGRFVPLFEKLCEVVHALHQQGIVHRDLKPANVMVVSRAGRLSPKLLDLGIAKFQSALESGSEPSLEERSERAAQTLQRVISAAETNPPNDSEDLGSGMGTASGAFNSSANETIAALLKSSLSIEITSRNQHLGTPAFMAPEQWTNPNGTGPPADVYSLGILAFQALTGNLPFRARNQLHLAAAHLKQPVPPLGAGFPEALNGVLQKALAKKPGDRYPTALELAAAFKAASGIEETAPLVPLDPELVEEWLLHAPQPLAEALIAVSSARQPPQAVQAILRLRTTSVRYLALIALAAQAKAGPQTPLGRTALELLNRLRQQGLADEEWWKLSGELVRPYADRAQAHAVPELVELLRTPDGAARTPPALGELLAQEGGDVAALGAALGRWMRDLAFLRNYALAQLKPGQLVLWRGARPVARMDHPSAPGDPPEGSFALVDAAGTLVLPLSPVVQAIAPTPGAPDQVFFLEGSGRYGARLVALPFGFERHDEAVWSWFREKLGAAEKEALRIEDEKGTPYLGLASFRTEQAANFFGREKEAEAFANRLRVQPLLAVVAPSGAGKSSFVQAGVIPLLPKDWLTITVRPGPSPCWALAEGLRQQGVPIRQLGKAVQSFPGELAQVLGDFASARGKQVLLVVDQFEELVTLCLDAAEQRTYAQALVRAASSPEAPVRVIVTLRDDFLIRLQALPALRERLAQGLQLLSTPAPEDLARILTEPARRAGYSFEDQDLIQEMVRSVEQQAGALALLSFTAAKLWEARDPDRRTLTRKAYVALGGVGGALAHHAEAVLALLEPAAQKLVREAFRQLVTAEGTRAVLSRKQLGELLGPGALAEKTLAALVDARLLVTSEGAEGEDRVEVIHEALLSSWPRLVKWQREDAENVRMRDQLRASARQWEQLGRRKGTLWRGDALLEFRVWRLRYPGRLTGSEEAFAAASLREEARGKRLKRSLIVLAFCALAIGLGVVVRGNEKLAQANHETAMRLAEFHAEQGRTAFLSGDVMHGLMYLGLAFKEGVDRPGFRYLLARAMHQMDGSLALFEGHTAGIWRIVPTPDGKRVVTAGIDGTVRVWDASTGRSLQVLDPKSPLWGVTVSPDGQRIAAGALNGSVYLWDSSGRLVGRLRAHEGKGPPDAEFAPDKSAWGFVFSPDGKLLATAGADATLRLWDGRTGAPLAVLPSAAGHGALAFSADGRTLLSAPGTQYEGLAAPKRGAAVVWDVAARRPRFSLSSEQGYVTSVAISPDGRRLATGGSDGVVRLWDARSGAVLDVCMGHDSSVNALAFSPDGTTLASASSDNTARLWNARDGRLVAILKGHNGPLSALAFSPSGDTLATASFDGTAKLWDSRSGQLLWTYLGHTDQLWTLAFSPDGSKLFTAGNDALAQVWRTDLRLVDAAAAEPAPVLGYAVNPAGTRALALELGALRLWDLTRQRVLSATTLPSPVSFFDWSPDGRFIAGPQGDDVAIWSFPEGKLVRRLTGHAGPIRAVFFSPSGRRVLTGSDDKTAKLWDSQTGQQLGSYSEASAVFQCALSPDEKTVAVVDLFGWVSTWDVQSGQRLARWKAHKDRILSLAFSPSAGTLLTASGDGTIEVWDVRDGHLIAEPPKQSDAVASAAFTPDGQLALTASLDGVLRVWDAGTWTEVDRFNSGAGTSFTAFVKGGEQILTGAGPTHQLRLWPASRSHLNPDQVATYLHCRVPLDFSRGELLVRPLSGAACAAVGAGPTRAEPAHVGNAD